MPLESLHACACERTTPFLLSFEDAKNWGSDVIQKARSTNERYSGSNPPICSRAKYMVLESYPLFTISFQDPPWFELLM